MARRSRRAATTVPLASMGDIAFLLITFFIITSSFVKNKGVELTEPESEDIELIESPPPIVVALDREGKILVDGQPMGSPSAAASRVSQLLESHFGQNTDQYEILFLADEKLTDSDYMPMTAALAETEARIQMGGREEQ
ncbi:MAG: ExbD/TolR family protein [Planctomycetota bacterium]